MESAFILIAFITLLVGVFDFAQFLFVHQALVERARLAARWGALSNATDPDAAPDLTGAANMVLYGHSSAPGDRTGYLGLTQAMVSVTTAGAGTDDYRLTVKISNYPFVILSPFAGGEYRGKAITVSAPMGYY